MKPLANAAWQGCDSTIRRLVTEGFSVYEQDGDGYTALMYASQAGHLQCVRLLLELGSDPDVHRSYDTFHTPLSLASYLGFFEIVKVLISRGANPAIYAGPWQVRAECYARHEEHHHISEFLQYQCP